MSESHIGGQKDDPAMSGPGIGGRKGDPGMSGSHIGGQKGDPRCWGRVSAVQDASRHGTARQFSDRCVFMRSSG